MLGVCNRMADAEAGPSKACVQDEDILDLHLQVPHSVTPEQMEGRYRDRLASQAVPSIRTVEWHVGGE